VLLIAFLGLAPTSRAQGVSPADLIAFLTYQSDRPEKRAVMLGMASCGHFREDRAAARSLVRLGFSVVPSIEEALDSIERSGERSPFVLGAGWLLDVYAQIEKGAAYPRIRKMMDNPRLYFLRLELDSSMALSLGLTSYVSGSRAPMRIFHCNRVQEPRDTLDQLILAWVRNDRPWLEASLGPNARAALQSFLKGKTWATMRKQLWHGRSDGAVAVAYRFDIKGTWSEPGETLEEKIEGESAPLESVHPEIETLFRNGSGRDCGRQRVKFLDTRSMTEPLRYRIDNSDLGELLRSIAACAATE